MLSKDSPVVKPVEVRSDNGTNFVGGKRELRLAIENWNQDKIHDFFDKRKLSGLSIPRQRLTLVEFGSAK